MNNRCVKFGLMFSKNSTDCLQEWEKCCIFAASILGCSHRSVARNNNKTIIEQ